jgi:membrane-bound ClpP family serine protease
MFSKKFNFYNRLLLVFISLCTLSWISAAAQDAPRDENDPFQEALGKNEAEKPAPKKQDKQADAKPVEPKPDAPKREAVKPKNANPDEVPVQLEKLSLPITDFAENRFRRIANQLNLRFPDPKVRPTLIIEFAPGETEHGQGSDFNRAHALANVLTEPAFQRIKTVAYIPKSIKGHAVLVALACEEVIMAPDASIGEAGIDEGGAISETKKTAYREIASSRRNVPKALALAMLDKKQEVFRVETARGIDYVDQKDLDELKKKQNVIKVEQLAPHPGSTSLSGQRAQQLGFVSRLAEDRKSVAQGLGFPENAMRENPSPFGDWNAIHLKIEGVITVPHLAEVDQKIREAVKNQNVNFILLEIDSAGGAPDASINLAQTLAGLDSGKVRTVAWSPRQARGDAAWIALGCDEIAIGGNAPFGGEGAKTVNEDIRRAIITTYTDVAKLKSKNWSAGAAVIGYGQPAFQYKNNDKGIFAIFNDDEFRKQENRENWIKQPNAISTANISLKVNGDRAVELGIATHVVGSLAELKQTYGLQNNPSLVEPGWADFLLRALRQPSVMWFLLVIGGASIYAELHTPGVGLGGIIAFVCFLLYFWGQFLEGTAGWLEVLLFISGLIFVLLEIFVLPGFGVFGFCGGLMMLVALILASQTVVFPSNSYQQEQLLNSLLIVFGAGVGMLVAAVGMYKLLPRAPGFRRMTLQPLNEQELELVSRSERLIDLEHLIGTTGKTISRLAPSGKAMFGDMIVDVVAPGEYIDPNAKVIVREVHGSRVVVHRVE